MRVFGIPGDSRSKLTAALANLETPFVLCWGANYPAPFEHAFNNCPRLNAIEQLYAVGKENLPTIEWTTRLADARRAVMDGDLVFGRTLIHTQGRDIVGPRSRRWSRRAYWTRVVKDVAEEWRIHAFRGKVIARGLKVQVEPPWRRMPVRNRANGWKMIHTAEPTQELRDVAVGAVKACGYDFGAVDILKDAAGALYVLEVNRAPGLDDYTLGRYVSAIGRCVRRGLRYTGTPGGPPESP